MRGACRKTSTRTERDRGPALRRLDRTSRIRRTAQDVDDLSPERRPDLHLLQPHGTSAFCANEFSRARKCPLCIRDQGRGCEGDGEAATDASRPTGTVMIR